MKSILIVDDEKKLREVYRESLEANGYRVLEADNASQANEVIKKEKPDLVLLDVRMPRVNGGVMFDVISMFHKSVKVIVNSVFPIDEQRRRVTGADEYNDKAQGMDALLEKIRRVLAS